MRNTERIFAFDLGTASLGECVREQEKILHLRTLIIPAEMADTKEQAKRRRQYRTRQAHQARELWWRECARQAGLEVLETRQPTLADLNIRPDPRMLKEFPAQGEDTIYTSCLLRIALLQGKPLEGWQIFKAIWSAIQHRGYDENFLKDRDLPNGNEKEDLKKNTEAVNEYTRRLGKMFGSREEFHFPCYYEAYSLGIWNPDRPNDLSGKIGPCPEPARNLEGSNKPVAVAPRELVVKEVIALLKQAGKKYPWFQGREEEVAFGPAKKQYASLEDRAYSKYRGKNWEWQGLLGQKVPRFDNRNLTKCRLIPRFNTCRAKDPLNQEVVFLMKLKNMRYFGTDSKEVMLTPKQLTDIFNSFKEKKSVTEKRWRKLVEGTLNGTVHPNHLEVEKPRTAGRASFCRPALVILKELLLSGKNPKQIHQELTSANKNTDPRKGLVKDDYRFLLDFPTEWKHFYIPDSRLEDQALNEIERKEKIEEIIGGVRNPVVRHRLALFRERLKELAGKFGEPDKVILELVRDEKTGFMNKKRKEEYLRTQKENRKAREQAKKELVEAGLLGGEKAIWKMMLFKEQAGHDFYSGTHLQLTDLAAYEIDHIVPQEEGGSDAFFNKILTTVQSNRDKGKRTPFEWLNNTPRWPGFVEDVGKSNLPKKKKALLTSEDAYELNKRYSELAATSYVAKLAQRVTALTFGWTQQVKGTIRKIFVANGAYTAKIRRQYRLNEILLSHLTPDQVQNLAQTGELEKKNRENLLHHALDALVISHWPFFVTYPKQPPVWFNKDFCASELKKVVPIPMGYEKAVLAESMHGRREILEEGQKKIYWVTRFGTGTSLENFRNLEGARKRARDILDPKIRKDFLARLQEPGLTEQQWQKFLDNYWTGKKPRKLAKIVSDKGLEFAECGKMPGQFLKAGESHRGQIVYRQRNKWLVAPVYAFESVYQKTKFFKEKYGCIFFFRTGQLVELRGDCGIRLPKGPYILKTIMHSGQVKLRTFTNSEEISAMIGNLMDKGQMRVYREK